MKFEVRLSRRGSKAMVAIKNLLGYSVGEQRNKLLFIADDWQRPRAHRCTLLYSPQVKCTPTRPTRGVPSVSTGVLPTSIARSKRFSPEAYTSKCRPIFREPYTSSRKYPC